MSVARVRALTHTGSSLIFLLKNRRNECCPCEGIDTQNGFLIGFHKYRVEMSVARVRALTQHVYLLFIPLGCVEMSVARVRALTHMDMAFSFLFCMVEMSAAHVKASQRIISEKSTKFPTEKISIFSKNRRSRRFFCMNQFSFTDFI